MIVTDELHTQRTLLDEIDFQALFRCLKSFPCMMFYNCGPEAGASQYHKHLQCIPIDSLNLQQKPAIPIDTAVDAYLSKNNVKPGDPFMINEFKFHHSFCHNSDIIDFDIKTGAEELNRRYHLLLAKSTENLPQELKTPHNFIMTPKWMLVVPRTKDKYDNDIPINSLGFIGCLITKQPEKIRMIDEMTPWRILESVSFPLEH